VYLLDTNIVSYMESFEGNLKKKLVISERDLQIASIALAKRLCVVTHNTKEFNRVEKLRVEDWAEVQ
jgi:tRNA(fMet)-specific endonuclease VapC